MFHKNEKGNMERDTHAGVTPFKVESGNNYDFTVSIAKKITIPDCELTLYLLARCTNVEGSEWQYVCPSNIINSKPEANNYEREPNVSSAGYFRTGESANVNFNFTPKKVGRYLFLLTERYNNAMLGYFAIYFTGETNAIRTVSIQQATDRNSAVFDLQGRIRTQQLPSSLRSVYIKNGKKLLNR